ncbi:MAG: EAL domain-containing protein [Gemmatimonadota bacterium]
MAEAEFSLSSARDVALSLPLAVTDDLVEGVVVVDGDSRIRYANPAMTRIFGYGRDELVGEELTLLMPEGHARRHRSSVGSYLETGRRSTPWMDVELPGRHRDGGELPLRISFSELRHRGERLFVGAIRDLSQAGDPEEAKRAVARRYRVLFDENVAAVFRAAPDGRILAANRAFARMAGFETAGEVEGDHLRDCWVDCEVREELLADLREHRAVHNRELELRRKDGSPVWVLAHAQLVDDPDHGEVIEGLFFDISEEVRARRAVRRAKEKFQGVFDISPVALKIVDPETRRYLEVNRAFEELFGCDRSDVIDGTVGREQLWEDPEREVRLYDTVRRGRTVRNEEVRLRRADGTPVDGLFSAGSFEVDGGEYIVAAVQDVTRLKEVERELELRALHDPLTELPNRGLFSDRLVRALARARRTGGKLAVLVLDLDGFRRVNDALGHGAGDEALRRLAGRLTGVFREQDTVARIGGDEFGVILEGAEDEDRVRGVAEEMLEAVRAPVDVRGQDVRIEGSCGAAVWDGAAAAGAAGGEPGVHDPDELLRRAELAMYAAKDEPGARCEVYDAGVRAAEPTRLREEMRLRRGLEHDEFVPYYQPILALDDRRLVGAEVLARWEPEGEATVPPGAFIPLAEETGLIVELGHRLTHRALWDFAGWRERGLTPEGFRLHLNLSARQLQDPELVASVAALLEDGGLDPEEITYEVTESAAMGRTGMMTELQELGVRLSVDDFGTEYATLNRLTEIEMDGLKIDRSFVSRMTGSQRHAAIVEATLALAEALGISAVAEGIETDAQLARLRQLGCPYGQGFLFARPMPAADFTALLERGGT